MGRVPDPLALPEPIPPGALNDPGVGNRFDSPTGEYRMRYFGTDLECCLGESLARVRPDPAVIAGVGEEAGYMRYGAVPADWRMRRMAVHVSVPSEALFVDVEAPLTRRVLRRELATLLASLEVTDLDVAIVRGGNRQVTRWIGHWAWRYEVDGGERPFSGVRYVSRLNSAWEAWAVFDHVEVVELQRLSLAHSLPELRRVAEAFELTIH